MGRFTKTVEGIVFAAGVITVVVATVVLIVR